MNLIQKTIAESEIREPYKSKLIEVLKEGVPSERVERHAIEMFKINPAAALFDMFCLDKTKEGQDYWEQVLDSVADINYVLPKLYNTIDNSAIFTEEEKEYLKTGISNQLDNEEHPVLLVSLLWSMLSRGSLRIFFAMVSLQDKTEVGVEFWQNLYSRLGTLEFLSREQTEDMF